MLIIIFFYLFQIAMDASQNNSLMKNMEYLAQRFRTLVQKESLVEKSLTIFLAIFEELGDLLNLIPGEHYKAIKVSTL